MKIEFEAKFNIGDKVYLKQDLMSWDGKSDTYGKPQPTPLFIIGLRPEICYQGIQVHYIIRTWSGNTDYKVISQIELHDKLEAL